MAELCNGVTQDFPTKKMHRDQILADKILEQLNESTKEFSGFQNQCGMHCPSECNKCCHNPEISCTPYELLPLAIELLKKNEAEKVLDDAYNSKNNLCVLMNVNNCREYLHRPFICRAFGVAARTDKHGNFESIICPILKENYPNKNLEGVPLIELWKKKLESIDPKLSEREVPINKALIIILEKLLLAKSFGSGK
jgi:Fe-S-cluster containining protein